MGSTGDQRISLQDGCRDVEDRWPKSIYFIVVVRKKIDRESYSLYSALSMELKVTLSKLRESNPSSVIGLLKVY